MDARIAQRLERYDYSVDVGGSIPSTRNQNLKKKKEKKLVAIEEKKTDKRPELIFKDGNKDGELVTIIITSEVFNEEQYKMWFEQKHGMTSIAYYESTGEYKPQVDMVPARFFNPAIHQARAIFSDYRKKRKNQHII